MENRMVQEVKNEAQRYADGIVRDLLDRYDAWTRDPDDEGYEDMFDCINSEALEIEYSVSCFGGAYTGARVYVTLGGPTCYIDTRDKVVRCYWGGELGEAYLYSDVADALDDALREAAYGLTIKE